MAVIWSDLLTPYEEWDRYIAVADNGLPLIASRVDNGFYVTNAAGVGSIQYTGRQVHAVAVSGSGNAIFAAVSGSGPAQLKKSIDAGATWVDTAFLTGVGYTINDIAVTNSADAIYLATRVGLYVSYNQGATATQLDSRPFTNVKTSGAGNTRIVALNNSTAPDF